MFSIKPGVTLLGIRPELLVAILAAVEVYRDNFANVTITSVTDGQHSRTSLHYTGAAVDLRTRDLTLDQRQHVRTQLAAALGAEFDVVLEATHLHIEYQPKR